MIIGLSLEREIGRKTKVEEKLGQNRSVGGGGQEGLIRMIKDQGTGKIYPQGGYHRSVPPLRGPL